MQTPSCSDNNVSIETDDIDSTIIGSCSVIIQKQVNDSSRNTICCDSPCQQQHESSSPASSVISKSSSMIITPPHTPILNNNTSNDIKRQQTNRFFNSSVVADVEDETILLHEDFAKVVSLVWTMKKEQQNVTSLQLSLPNCDHRESKDDLVTRMEKVFMSKSVQCPSRKRIIYRGENLAMDEFYDECTNVLLDQKILSQQSFQHQIVEANSLPEDSNESGESKREVIITENNQECSNDKKNLGKDRSRATNNNNKKESIVIKYPKHQTDILMDWMIENKSNPIPDMKQIEYLMNQTGLNAIQIVNWTTNVRKRNIKATCHGNKKPYHFIDFLFLAQQQAEEQQKIITTNHPHNCSTIILEKNENKNDQSNDETNNCIKNSTNNCINNCIVAGSTLETTTKEQEFEQQQQQLQSQPNDCRSNDNVNKALSCNVSNEQSQRIISTNTSPKRKCSESQHPNQCKKTKKDISDSVRTFHEDEQSKHEYDGDINNQDNHTLSSGDTNRKIVSNKIRNVDEKDNLSKARHVFVKCDALMKRDDDINVTKNQEYKKNINGKFNRMKSMKKHINGKFNRMKSMRRINVDDDDEVFKNDYSGSDDTIDKLIKREEEDYDDENNEYYCDDKDSSSTLTQAMLSSSSSHVENTGSSSNNKNKVECDPLVVVPSSTAPSRASSFAKPSTRDKKNRLILVKEKDDKETPFDNDNPIDIAEPVDYTVLEDFVLQFDDEAKFDDTISMSTNKDDDDDDDNDSCPYLFDENRFVMPDDPKYDVVSLDGLDRTIYDHENSCLSLLSK